MAQSNKMNALQVEKRAKTPGRYGDGAGLYLEVVSAHSRYWTFRYMMRGKARQMGLGPYPDVTLAKAREKAAEARKLKAAGIDPLDARRDAQALAQQEAGFSKTFRECAEEYIGSLESGWRNEKHKAQWASTLERYAYPRIGSVSVSAVDTEAVLAILKPIWGQKNTTANRLRGRIEAVLDYAAALGRRRGENPARWRGHLAKILPGRSSVHSVKHHSALPYAEVPSFLALLKAQAGIAAMALQFTILTATRTGEAIGAKWSEIDRDAGTWTIPADRTKTKRAHRVPLSASAVAILDRLEPLKPLEGGWLFPGARPGRPLSNMAMLATLDRMQRRDITVHGFRSTFRDWAAEQTNFAREVAEAALAHAIGDKVEAAYRRGDLFEKRRKLMEAWAGYCAKEAGANVVQFAKVSRA